jgi:hypothetical protein
MISWRMSSEQVIYGRASAIQILKNLALTQPRNPLKGDEEMDVVKN